MSGLGSLAKTLDKLARVPSQIAGDAAKTIATEIQRQFDNGLDPYGEPWEQLADSTVARGRTPPPLTDTWEMRDGIEVRPMPGSGISISFEVDYAIHHQYGAPRANVPQRAILPPAGVLPDTWKRALADAQERAFKRAWAG